MHRHWSEIIFPYNILYERTTYNQLRFQLEKLCPRQVMRRCQSNTITSVKNAQIAYCPVINTKPSEKRTVLLFDWLGELS